MVNILLVIIGLIILVLLEIIKGHCIYCGRAIWIWQEQGGYSETTQMGRFDENIECFYHHTSCKTG